MSRSATKAHTSTSKQPSRFYSPRRKPEKLMARIDWWLRYWIRGAKKRHDWADVLGLSVAHHVVMHLSRMEPPCLWCGMYLSEREAWHLQQVSSQRP